MLMDGRATRRTLKSAIFTSVLLIRIFFSGSVWAEDFPFTIMDSLHRTVTVRRMPQRIVSLSPSNTEILFAVGAGNEVVGVTTYCDYPPEAARREKIGGFLGETISVEKILSLGPDLVVSDGIIHKSVVRALENAGITVFANEPESFYAVCASIETVGRLTGHETQARAVTEGTRKRLAAVREKVSVITAPERPSVFWIVNENPLMSAGDATLISELISLAGGRNIFSGAGPQWPEVGGEQVIRENPSVIMGTAGHGSGLTVERIRRRAGWERVEAVASGRIYLVDANIVSRAGPRLVEAVEIIAKALHPRLFQSFIIPAKIDRIHRSTYKAGDVYDNRGKG